MFYDIRPIKGQNIPFDAVYPVKIFAFSIFLHRLRHSTHNEILSEIVHCLTVHHLSHSFPGIELFTNNFHQGIIAHRPQKFFKIHRIHLDMSFFGRNNDVLDIFPDRHKRPCFQIIIPAIRNQIFDCRPRTGEHLHLVKNNKGFMFIQFDVVVSGQIHKQSIQIVQVIPEQIFDFIAYTIEVNQQIRLILRFGKLFCHITLPYTPRTVNQKCCFSYTILFPPDKLIIYLSLQRKASNHENKFFTNLIYHENEFFTIIVFSQNQ